jgi:uncharacterized membrane protein YphA (DoxX/SURF4 family)
MVMRMALGGFFIYMGITKALHPIDFLKLLREYQFGLGQLPLNAVAAFLPWLEVFCGFCLLAGVAVRGSSLLVFVMLVTFTAAVLHRALSISRADALALCAIRFDCGCGGGPQNACRKLLENVGLCLFSLAVLRFAHRDANVEPD